MPMALILFSKLTSQRQLLPFSRGQMSFTYKLVFRNVDVLPILNHLIKMFSLELFGLVDFFNIEKTCSFESGDSNGAGLD